MERLDPTTDLSFLLGKALEQVCRGSYQLQLNFTDESSIAIETTTEYRPGGTGVTSHWFLGAHSEFPIYELLHKEDCRGRDTLREHSEAQVHERR